MERMKVFKCVDECGELIPDELLEDLNSSYEEINYDANKLSTLSKRIKIHKNLPYCKLPFCHTIEAEAFGAKVVFDHKLGNRISGYAIDDVDSIENMKSLDLSKGRIGEVLKAVDILKSDGENVVLDITGPITIATSIMDSSLFFKAARKDKDKVNELLKLIEDSTVDYIIEAVNRGVDVISYADPAGTMDIVGPRFFKEFAGKTMYNILNRVVGKLDNSIMHLCIKVSSSLESSGFLEVEKIKGDGDSYFQMIKSVKSERKDINLIGHWCMNSKKKTNEIIGCKLADI